MARPTDDLRRLDGPDGASPTDPLELYRTASRPPTGDRPWVLANMVAGLDGAIATGGRVGALSSRRDRAVFWELRALADMILVGAGTVRAEGYGPARPSEERRRQREARGQTPAPAIAVVTATLQLDFSAPFFTEAESRPVVVTTARSDVSARERAAEHAEVVVAGDERVDPNLALAELRLRGADVVLCEGGPSLNSELLTAGCLDELCLTVSPTIGGDPIRIVADEPPLPLTRFELAHVLRGGDELYLRYVRPRAVVGHG